MKYSLVALAGAAGPALAASSASAYGQCGGQGWTGATTCVSGWHCTYSNPYYSQCLPGAASSAAPTTLKTSARPTTTKKAAAPTSKTPVTTSKAAVTTSKAAATTSKAAATTSAAASPAGTSGKIKYGGVNIAGFDFGCGTDGTCSVSGIVNVAATGATQMKHFVTQDGLNAFRLPVGWQYLVNNNLGGTLDATNFGNYNTLVQNCLSSGAALCIIDIHNYARWNGNIIGQSSVTDAQFSSLWSQLATKYASSPKVAFGIMNEPHDVPNISTWAATVQAAVTAIRKAGATSNLILLPGNDWTHASSSISDGSYAALSTVKNLDGSTNNLIFDVHQYLDSDGSGTHADCTTDNVAAFTTLATQLRKDKRQAMLTETGGGPNDATCLKNVCAQLQYLAKNADVYLGWTGWAAGGFDTSYVLSETPNGSADQQLVTQCIAGMFK
ncbi:endoglucanase EG-II [Elsinoe australis]|uniref:Endoglucanase EG-II n=1 Tax=Elsinoe australis TaxID=40998 RepID=A0A4U7B4N0_9PEZI|nr:endoglucanase EG-II [Elsinoe australis]